MPRLTCLEARRVPAVAIDIVPISRLTITINGRPVATEVEQRVLVAGMPLAPRNQLLVPPQRPD